MRGGRPAEEPGERAAAARGRAAETGSGALTPEADQAARDLLSQGSLEVLGRWSRRPTRPGTARSARGDYEAACVYKPIAGERPLWDFPDGTLAGREVAAYVVSRGVRAGTWCRRR